MMTVPLWKACYGYFGLVLPGPICRTGFRHTQPSFVDSASGSRMERCGMCLKPWRWICKLEARSICPNASSMAPSWWRKKGRKVGKTKRGKGTKLMAIADAAGLPLAVHTASASPHKVTLVEATVDEIVIVGLHERLVRDRAYDSNPLDGKLAVDGIEVIAPYRTGRVRPATQDGRSLRRYKRRWKIERLFAWLKSGLVYPDAEKQVRD